MDSFGLLFVYLLLYAACFIMCVLFVRWIFKIGSIVSYHKKQYLLLRQIAEKLGVDEMLLHDIDKRN